MRQILETLQRSIRYNVTHPASSVPRAFGEGQIIISNLTNFFVLFASTLHHEDRTAKEQTFPAKDDITMQSFGFYMFLGDILIFTENYLIPGYDSSTLAPGRSCQKTALGVHSQNKSNLLHYLLCLSNPSSTLTTPSVARG